MTRVQPFTDVSTTTSCPCSVDFKGNTTCCKVTAFLLCLILIAAYVGMFVMGVVLFGGCKVYFVDMYMVMGGILCTPPVLVFAVWLCNRCCDATFMVGFAVFTLTLIIIGSFFGAFFIVHGQCDLQIKYLAIGFSSPVWLFSLLLAMFWVYKNFIIIRFLGEDYCLEDPRERGCICCDCEAGAVGLVNCLD